MAKSSVSAECGNCDGTGDVPTDEGPVACPDCGGAGFLPSSNVLVEWRAREIERLYARGDRQLGQDIDWLIFELRRARSALTNLIALADDAGDDATTKQIRFIASEALGLYLPEPADQLQPGRETATESSATATPRTDTKPPR
jgi:hypothetical protein